MEEKFEFILFFQIDGGKIAIAARNLINSAPQTDAMTFGFVSVSMGCPHHAARIKEADCTDGKEGRNQPLCTSTKKLSHIHVLDLYTV